MIKDVKDLEVYNASLMLLPKIYSLAKRLLSSEKDLISQMKRASKSIPANIAEGFAKRYAEKEFKRFLKIALGSSDEMITHLRVTCIVAPFCAQTAESLKEEYIVLSKRINTLCSHWHSNGNF